VSESEWLSFLTPLAPFKFPTGDVVIVAPHPDDETLGAGGLIYSLRTHGISVTVIAVTDGENAYKDEPGLGATRIKEQTDALSALGVGDTNIARLHLPDGDVAAHELKLVRRTLPLVSAATDLIAPLSGDFHPDHEACGRAAKAVALQTGARLSSYLFWTWHRGTPEALNKSALRSFDLDEAAMTARESALRYHHSQLEHPSGAPILPDLLLAPARRPFEVFLVDD
jgi:LmbE family N-acetylglucosaminyl deacetylase